ncbi:MAG: sensor histidine kinase [Flavobacteriales bacterium]
MTMPFRLLNFTLWFLVYFIGMDMVSDILYFSQTGEGSWWWQGKTVILISGFVVFFVDALAVYALLYKWYKDIGVFGSALIILVMFPAMIGFRYLVEEILCDWLFSEHNYNPNTALDYYFIDNIYFTSVYISFGILYFFIHYNRYRDEQQKQLAEQNKKAELDFLQSQINPHFLFNNLNSIYSLVYAKSDQALPAMDRMTELLRYGLYERQAMVSVGVEVNYLKNYIELQKLRFDYPIQLEIQLEEMSDDVKIPPLILIPFVENAFKHGSFRKEDEVMKIYLRKENNTLSFYVSNVIRRDHVDTSGGLGLSNVRRRLELIYGERHSLQIDDSGSRFEVNLTLPL